MRFFYRVVVIVFMLFSDSSFAQTSADKVNFEQGLDALLFINYSAEDEFKPKNTVFYFDDYSNYLVKATRRLEAEALVDEVLSECSRFSTHELISEVEIEGFNFEVLKENMMKYPEEYHISLVFYDYEKSITILKVYKMGVD